MDDQNDKQLELPFVLSSTVNVSFTNAQLVEIALDTLNDNGHEFDPTTVVSSFNKTGLTLTIENVVGNKPPIKRRRKKTSKKASKKLTQEESTEEPEVKAPVEDKGDTPFEPATKEATIAEVKKKEGLPEKAPFSTDTLEIADSDSEVAPAKVNPFDFSEVDT